MQVVVIFYRHFSSMHVSLDGTVSAGEARTKSEFKSFKATYHQLIFLPFHL
jgi:hypothetical protein